jgi:chloramphenicol-sensitive protein RarD
MDQSQRIYGVVMGLAAFAMWGLLPAYWKQMQAVSAFEILCHRIVWSCIFLTLILTFQKRWTEVQSIFTAPGRGRGLLFSGLLIGVNWFIYIVAVNSNRVVETSLGYYITPMINVVLGYLLLRESFNRMQCLALAFALAGISYSLAAYGTLPVFALSLAISFGFYGYCHKRIQTPAIPGLFVETLVLFVPAAGFILYQIVTRKTFFMTDPALTAWMIGSGVVTSLPLLWFAGAARHLNLSTIGILQYLAPSIAFVLGIFVYNEPFSRHSLITFVCIWTGVILYSVGSFRKTTPARKGADPGQP